ncbi:amp dependent CoA ligase [Crepidotus variabilis]|uniref:Amp dependent CoA ligase n=1 Tax=Crepidotus variabilis TaxID=179855 RepID=A0A9P6EE21_9AGAR|nr:amp dependent CoA ligase [Crepidotus variabilis]
MTLFQNPFPVPHIPDDLTIPQFMLREPSQLPRARNIPWFINDKTGRSYCFEEVHHRTFGLANALSIKWSIAKDDVVCLFSPNHVDYANVVWAVHTLGGIISPANPGYTPDELVHQLTTAKAKLLVTHPVSLKTALAAAKAAGLPNSSILVLEKAHNLPNLPTLDELIDFGASLPSNYSAVRLRPGESKTTIAFLCFSSGTTGKPKAVIIPHYSIIANTIQTTAHFHLLDPQWPNKRFLPGDVILGVLPFFHIYGLVVIMHFTLYCGASIVAVPKFNFEEFLSSIHRFKATHLFVVPPQVVLLCKHPAAKNRVFDHVKMVVSGAAPLSGDLMQQVTKIFPNASIGQGFGMTESAATVSFIQADKKIGTIGSAGGLIPGIIAKVVKADGSLGKEGEQGELVIKGPANALGYLNNPKATAETFVDGWLRTGDEVIIKDNEIFVVDRLKEIMKVRGFQVAPAELEGHLLLHPDVKDACVVGIPDDYSGEIPLAYVVPSDAAQKEIQKGPAGARKIQKEIEKHVSDNKVRYKWLAGGVVFIDTVPKNPSGKILRRHLRDQARAERASRAKLVEAKL